jgi:hypothetical protein
MTAFPSRLARAASRTAEWLQGWKRRYFAWRISRAQRSEIAGIARETGMTVDDVRTLAGLGIHGATLLRQRMAVLQIDLDRVSQIQAEVFRELQKSCSRCNQHGRCGHDLLGRAGQPADSDWKSYCPNTEVLDMLGALSSTSAGKARE